MRETVRPETLQCPSSAKRTRVTLFTPVSFPEAGLEEYGCEDEEVLSGLASVYQPDQNLR